MSGYRSEFTDNMKWIVFDMKWSLWLEKGILRGYEMNRYDHLKADWYITLNNESANKCIMVHPTYPKKPRQKNLTLRLKITVHCRIFNSITEPQSESSKKQPKGGQKHNHNKPGTNDRQWTKIQMFGIGEGYFRQILLCWWDNVHDQPCNVIEEKTRWQGKR